MGSQFSQFFPPKPHLTAETLEPQTGKVFIVTGGYSGVGLELVRMLYSAHGRIYIAGRSESKANDAIAAIKTGAPDSHGSVDFLYLKLDDLASIKVSVEAFLAKEDKLNVLWNNAGISQPPVGSISEQGLELQMATNCLGPFLFTQLLLPTLQRTSNSETGGPTRVIWTSSQIVELQTPPSGLIIAELHNPPADKGRNYVNSKVGNWLLSNELARRVGPSVLSIALNPGAASTSLFRHTPILKYLAWPLLYSPRLAACTQLYAGLSGDITKDNNGCYVLPFGRLADQNNIKPEFLDRAKAKEFWSFCEAKTHHYC